MNLTQTDKANNKQPNLDNNMSDVDVNVDNDDDFPILLESRVGEAASSSSVPFWQPKRAQCAKNQSECERQRIDHHRLRWSLSALALR